MVKRKPEVKVTPSPYQTYIETGVDRVLWLYHALPALVTSANDGAHKEGSRHYTDEAEDFSIRVILEKLHEDLEAELGPDYQVIYEPDKWAIVDGELKQVRWMHYHVEHDPK